MVWVFGEGFVTAPIVAEVDGRRMAFPPRVNAPALALKVMLLKMVPPTKSLLGDRPIKPSKNNWSFAEGAVSRSQLAGEALQLTASPPPSQVLSAADEESEPA